MKTTLDIPDSLFRQVKVKAALDGRKFKDLVAEGLTMVLLEKPPSTALNASSDKGGQSLIPPKRDVPDWYGSLAAYVQKGRIASDMKSIRDSIARGIVQERQL